MSKSLVGALLGAFVGGVLGVIIANTRFSSPSNEIKPGAVAISTVVGGGLGAIAGAIVGCTGAIVEAMGRGRRGP